jgi:hypothetical protein
MPAAIDHRAPSSDGLSIQVLPHTSGDGRCDGWPLGIAFPLHLFNLTVSSVVKRHVQEQGWPARQDDLRRIPPRHEAPRLRVRRDCWNARRLSGGLEREEWPWQTSPVITAPSIASPNHPRPLSRRFSRHDTQGESREHGELANGFWGFQAGETGCVANAQPRMFFSGMMDVSRAPAARQDGAGQYKRGFNCEPVEQR